MALDTKVLRDSFKIVEPRADELSIRFYEILFERYPSVQPLFEPARMVDQRHMFLRAFAIIVRKVDDSNYLTNYLEGLGKTHVAYGALPAHYDAVGECLIAALKEIIGSQWNQSIEDAWTTAYGIIKKVMLDGANMK